MKLELATPQKGTSWPSLISDIELVGEQHGKAFPLDKETSIRPAISTHVKKDYPNRVYKANKKVKDGIRVIWVWRKV